MLKWKYYRYTDQLWNVPIVVAEVPAFVIYAVYFGITIIDFYKTEISVSSSYPSRYTICAVESWELA